MPNDETGAPAPDQHTDINAEFALLEHAPVQIGFDEPSVESAGDSQAVPEEPQAVAAPTPLPVEPAQPAPSRQDLVLEQVAQAVKALADIQARSNQPPPPEPEISLLDRFHTDADFRTALLQQYNFDPTNPRDILAMDGLLQQKAAADRIAAIEQRYQQLVEQAQQQTVSLQATQAFEAATAQFEGLPQKTVEALRATTLNLTKQGIPANQAAEMALEPFRELFRAKGVTPPPQLQAQPQPQNRRPIDLAAARLAAAKSNGNPSRPVGPLKKGEATAILEKMEGYRGWG